VLSLGFGHLRGVTRDQYDCVLLLTKVSLTARRISRQHLFDQFYQARASKVQLLATLTYYSHPTAELRLAANIFVQSYYIHKSMSIGTTTQGLMDTCIGCQQEQHRQMSPVICCLIVTSPTSNEDLVYGSLICCHCHAFTALPNR